MQMIAKSGKSSSNSSLHEKHSSLSQSHSYLQSSNKPSLMKDAFGVNQGQKSVIFRVEEQLSQQKKERGFKGKQVMKREQSKAMVMGIENIEDKKKQKLKEKEVKIPILDSEESIAALKEDYSYVMGFLAREIDEMKGQVDETGLTEELQLVFPSQEEVQLCWQDQHPGEMCSILRDYVRYFVKLNAALENAKYQGGNEKHLIEHAAQLERLQFTKREHEYLFTIDQLSKQRDALSYRLNYIEKHFQEAIEYLCNDNEELIHLIKDKDNVMNKIQDQVDLKNEHIRSQDQKLLSVLIYEFKLRKIDIRYQAQILKIMKHHTTDLQKYCSILDSCWKGLSKSSQLKAEDQLNYLKAYVQGIKNDLYNQILEIQSKHDKFADSFKDKKKNYNQLNEVQDKIQEIQLFQNEAELPKKIPSKFSQVSFAQKIQNGILSSANSQKNLKKQVRSIKDVQFVIQDSINKNTSPPPPIPKSDLSASPTPLPSDIKRQMTSSSEHLPQNQQFFKSNRFASPLEFGISNSTSILEIPAKQERVYLNQGNLNNRSSRPRTGIQSPLLFSSQSSSVLLHNQYQKDKSLISTSDQYYLRNNTKNNSLTKNNSMTTGNTTQQNSFHNSSLKSSLIL